MARTDSASTTVIPVLREDGTVYFDYAGKTIHQRLGEWILAVLWSVVAGVIVATLVWV